MVRIGLIHRYDGYRGFSTKFENSITTLLTKINSFQCPSENEDERNMEMLLIETARTDKSITHRQRKKKVPNKDKGFDPGNFGEDSKHSKPLPSPDKKAMKARAFASRKARD